MSDAQRWMLAASAVLTQVNSNSHVLLAGDEHEGHNQCGKNTLKDSWDVSNRDELLGTLGWLQQEGHSAQFNQMGKDWRSHSVKERQARLTKITAEDERAQLEIVEAHAARLGAKALMAWDLGRLISVVRFAFAAGYVTEAEAWRLILPNAQELQAHYSSWEELGREFLLGRKFWAPSNDSSRHQAAYQQLLADPCEPVEHHRVEDPAQVTAFTPEQIELLWKSVPLVSADEAEAIAERPRVVCPSGRHSSKSHCR